MSARLIEELLLSITIFPVVFPPIVNVLFLTLCILPSELSTKAGRYVPL